MLLTIMLSATLALSQCDGLPEAGPVWAILTAQLRNADLTVEARRDVLMRQSSPGQTEAFDLDVLVANPPLGAVEIVHVAAMDAAGNRSEDCTP